MPLVGDADANGNEIDANTEWPLFLSAQYPSTAAATIATMPAAIVHSRNTGSPIDHTNPYRLRFRCSVVASMFRVRAAPSSEGDWATI